MTELILKAKEEARRRISAIRAEEARVRKVEEARTAAKKRKLDQKRKQREAAAEAEAGGPGEGGAGKKRRLTTDSQQEKERRDNERRRKQQEENLNPVGPFSAPPMQQTSLLTSNLECPGTIETKTSQSKSNSHGSNGSEAVKVDNTAPMADIASNYDVLLGDFELALHNHVRQGTLSSINKRRGFRFVDKFR